MRHEFVISTVKPLISGHPKCQRLGGHLQEVVAYKWSDHSGLNFELSKIILPKNFGIQVNGFPVINYLVWGMGQVYFGIPDTSDCDIHVSCTSQECTCDNVTKANCPTSDTGWI